MRKILQHMILPVMLLATTLLSGADIPYLSGRVNDYAGVMTPATRQMLGDSLRAHEERTGNQVVVLTITTLGGDNIEDYANRVFNTWKLGQEEKDNGILIVVVPDDRCMRIEVGYGLEGVMPDLLASRIIQEVMTPRFSEGDYDGGISEGVSTVLKVLDGEDMAPAEESRQPSEEASGFSDINTPDMSITMRILMGAFIFGIIGLFTFLGIVTPGQGWFLYFFLIPFWATFPIIIVGSQGTLICLITYLVAFPVAKILLKRTGWYKKAGEDMRTKGRASVGGFTFSSGSSGSSWSSGGSSGFSGGGGSSGGGGASGSW